MLRNVLHCSANDLVSSSDRETEVLPVKVASEYFFDDGDCTFLAGEVLFKVHKWVLCRDPESMFRGMFSAPQTGVDSSESDVISLTDSSAEFSALCWGLYAHPNEIYLQTTHEANIGRLVDAAKMYNKYVLPSFESWALNMLVMQCKPPLDRLATCAATPEVYERIMELAELCARPALLSLVEEAWLPRLRTGELHCAAALSAAEKHGRRRFQGEVYYHLNTRLHRAMSNPTPCTNTSFEPLFAGFGLSDAQLLRLLSGHLHLANFWRHLRAAGLEYTIGCKMLKHMHEGVCVPAFAAIQWPTDTADVRKGLMGVRDAVTTKPAPVPWGIQTCVGSYLERMIERFSNVQISEYFLGPEMV